MRFRYPLSAIRYPLSVIRYPLSPSVPGDAGPPGVEAFSGLATACSEHPSFAAILPVVMLEKQVETLPDGPLRLNRGVLTK